MKLEESMKKNKKKKKLNSATIFSAIIGGIFGFFIVYYMEHTTEWHVFGWNDIIFLSFALVACLLHIIIHEAGHLVCGLLSGYQFASFRIGSFMWIKEDEKIKCKRFSLAGTGGQCLMSPPDLVDGKIPYVLYNLGGSLANIVIAVISFGLYFLLKESWVLSTFFIIVALLGVVFALLNGIPMKSKMVNNDGYNALSLGKDKDALRAFWIQMKANEQITKGKRLREMPEEGFNVPTDEQMNNSMVAVLGVFACNRLMDEHKFQEADALMERFVEMDSSIVEIHKNLLICDRIYCELISENRKQKVEEMYNADLKKFMKAMKNYPSVIRTQYVYVLLCERNQEQAKKLKEQFEKVARNYPYPSDAQAERELMGIAEERV